MDNHSASDLDALLDDPTFRRWVYAPTEADEQHWQTWLRQHPDQRPLVETARHLLLNVRGNLPELSDHELTGRVTQLLAQADDTPVRVWPLRPRWGWYAAAAAVVALLLTWVGMRWGLPGQADRETGAAIRRVMVVNETGQPRLVALSDGSSVILQTGSRLTYEQPFRPDSRRVWLTGEAFFEVTKKPHHPFRVQAGQRFATQVMGTSFRVRAYSNEPSGLIVVKTGRVAVFRDSTFARSPEVVLTARQQTTVRAEQRVTPVAATLSLPIERQSFQFTATPLPQVVHDLETAYGVTINLSPNLANCTLTASLGDEPLPQKLHMLTAAIDATYQIDGQQVKLEGAGCK